MPNAAPFIAPPWKRVAAGAVDGVLFLLLFIVAIAAVTSVVGDLWGPGLAAVAAATYVVYHVAFFLVLEDATPGLRALNMRIVSTTAGGSLSLAKMLVRSAFRPVMLYAFAQMVYLVHPFFAAEPMLFAPLLVELAMMFTLPSRQTLSDLVARTLVVNVPPPQPHRAPAGPMYSPSDAEFGLPPGRRAAGRGSSSNFYKAK